MSSSSTPPQTIAPGEVEPPLTRPSAPPAVSSVGAAPGPDATKPLSGKGQTTTLAMRRESDAPAMNSSLTRRRRPRPRKRRASSVSYSSSSGPSRDMRRSSTAAASSEITARDSPQDSLLMPPSDTSATSGRRQSAPDGLASQSQAVPTAVRRVSIQLNPLAAVSAQRTIGQAQQPSGAPAPKRASIIKSTATRSSSAEPVVAIRRSGSMAAAPSSGSEGALPRRFSMARRRSLDRWFARKFEDQAQAGRLSHRSSKDFAGAFTPSRERALSANWLTPAGSTGSSVARLAHQTVMGLQLWSSYRHPALTSDSSQPLSWMNLAPDLS
ncbi:uncharacterized protein DDB_G0284671-like isoform X2 [Dermacentor albipictus]|uniref:uncharacterized protein DDB_G0284671-like isoform X2 n=1 Tax=Dermacentor albipictus TaxID=60249 RepID=UPI0038FBF288